SAWITPAQDLQSATKLTRAERFNDASTAFKQLIKSSPNNGDIYYYFGENILAEYFADTINNTLKRAADSANMIFQQGIQAEPVNPLNFVGMGEVALLQKNLADADKMYSKAISLLPSKQNKSAQVTPEKQSIVYTKMAAGFVRAEIRDTARVFGYLRNAERLDKNNFELYLTRGDAYIYLLNDGSNAILNYNEAQRLNPTSATAKLRIGQLWVRARKYQDALTWYQQGIQIDPNFAPAYRELGYLLSRANRNDEAQQNYKKYLELSSGNIQARIQYVNTLMELKKYPEAISELQTILKTDSSNNDLNRALAYAYFETQQYEQGIYYSKKFFRNSKPDKIRPLDYAYLGRLLAKTKQDSLASEMLLKAFTLDSTKAELLSEAALTLIRGKNFNRAIDIYNAKIQMNKAVPVDYYNLGKVYYNLKEWKESDSILNKFTTMMPDFMQGYLWRARALVNIDSTSKLGLAKPVYETMIQKAMVDSVKNGKELKEAYSYLSYYYFLQFRETKDQQMALSSVDYCKKVLSTPPADPTFDEKAKAILKEVEPKIRK
ncbi:MAG: tetratricopeptide repeat protein, partial [Syntrophothermus sp.]